MYKQFHKLGLKH